MEVSSGILGRLGEKVLGWIALGLLVFIGIAIYQTPAETKQAIWSGIWRSIAWIVIVGVIPWTANLFITKVLASGNNWAAAGLVGGFTLADIIAGLTLITVWPSGVWGWLVLLGALALAATYNFLVADYLADQAGG